MRGGGRDRGWERGLERSPEAGLTVMVQNTTDITGPGNERDARNSNFVRFRSIASASHIASV